MKVYTQLPVLEAFDWLSEELETERQAITDEFEKLKVRRDQFDTSSAKVQATDIADLDYSAVQAADKLRETAFRLAQDELIMREKRLDAYYRDLLNEARQERQRLERLMPVLEAEIVAKLEAMGYVPFSQSKSQAGQWNPTFVHTHPDRINCMWATEAIGRFTRSRPESPNAEAVKALREQLESFRRVAVG
ncbi:hypothetical protein [Planctomicrobium piriforme]|uniref:Uncharacterized protein n=1 Tax=Planctomicrobium piriforme TaxID=1576369 RepID=A0A1I3L2C3_9PLAN|nr:hypothetical protein [Planctomicrobium piriforme]SFI78893.1 hypothetical protein SAMN05421753_112118 [Planctomicrobium piriforme]